MLRKTINFFYLMVLAIIVAAVTILFSGVASAVSTWVVGEKEHPWEKAGISKAIDLTTKLGWIQPEYTDSTVNVVLKTKERGGVIWSPQYWAKYLESVLADGNHDTKWNMVPYSVTRPARGVSLLIDLGTVFPLNRIIFFTGEGQENRANLLKGYQVYVNDGDPKNFFGGEPIYQLLARNTENEAPVIDLRFPLQYVRYIKLLVDTDYGFVINEVEAYGLGYTPQAEYESDPIDLGGPANFGIVKLSAQIDPAAEILLRTRTGLTPDPYIYYKKTGVGEEEIPVSKEEYYKLPKTLKGKVIPDLENWSSWSFPYNTQLALDGTPMLSPGNRRYLQFKINFISKDFTNKGSVDYLLFEYSTPPVAHQIVAEISPHQVNLGEVTSFKYYVRPSISGNDTGFDALEIQTPYQAQVTGVKINNFPVVFSSQVEANRFRIFLNRKVRRDALIEVNFSCLVTIYGTTFWGEVFDTQSDEVPQHIIPGDATPDVDTNSLSVSGTLGGSLLRSVVVLPNPFTPNNDGINDIATISYTLLKAKKPVNVEISIYDLYGNLVRTLYSSKDLAGNNAINWDGTDQKGRRLLPGVYIYKLSVWSDIGVSTKTGTITLAY